MPSWGTQGGQMKKSFPCKIEEAVSPNIGVILMLSITVLIGAIVASMSFKFLPILTDSSFAATSAGLVSVKSTDTITATVIAITHLAGYEIESGRKQTGHERLDLKILITPPDGYQYEVWKSSTYTSGTDIFKPGSIVYIFYDGNNVYGNGGFWITDNIAARKNGLPLMRDISKYPSNDAGSPDPSGSGPGTGTWTVIIVDNTNCKLISKLTLNV